MNRAEKRRQQKLANKLGKPSSNDQLVNQKTFELAVQHHTAGRLKQAETLYKQILKSDSKHPFALHLLGFIAIQNGNNNEAIDLIERSITIKPDFTDALINLGVAYNNIGLLNEAVSSYQKALTFKPDNVKALNNLGISLKKMGRLDEAARHFQKAIAFDPSFAEAHNNLSNVFLELGRHNEAVESSRKAIALQPNFAKAHNNLANILKEQGKFDEARDRYLKAIEISPDFAEAYRHLSTTQKYSAYNDDIKAMEKAYALPNLQDDQKMHLAFALGKVFEDLKQHEKSFEYYLTGNALRRKTYDFSTQDTENDLNVLKSLFTKELFSSHAKTGSQDETPIFVLGMPRSGTTLVEQILSQHPDVCGAGELVDFEQVIASIFGEVGDKTFNARIEQSDQKEISNASQDYIDRIRTHSDTARYIINKLPNNFWFVGLIKLIFPHAKVIHCCRDAKDTCLSIFKNFFPVEGHYYAYDLRELGHYHKCYQNLMSHWHGVIPGFVYDIQYEDLVADQEGQSKALLEHCGLEWTENCLNFHTSQRTINTATAAQVRKPIYTTSIQSWKPYKKQLAPLFESLKE